MAFLGVHAPVLVGAASGMPSASVCCCCMPQSGTCGFVAPWPLLVLEEASLAQCKAFRAGGGGRGPPPNLEQLGLGRDAARRWGAAASGKPRAGFSAPTFPTFPSGTSCLGSTQQALRLSGENPGRCGTGGLLGRRRATLLAISREGRVVSLPPSESCRSPSFFLLGTRGGAFPGTKLPVHTIVAPGSPQP